MNKQKIVLRIILTVCILAVVFFAAAIIRELYIDSQSRSFYSGFTGSVDFRAVEPGYSVSDDSGYVQPDDPLSQETGWVPYVDFEALGIVYPGIVGWIKLENSDLHYPVMQYRDNDFFLTRLPDGTPHRNGSIFLDYRNNSDFSDKSILIFGHETRRGDMFGMLKNYRDQEFYEANPVMFLYTPEKDYTIVLFAAYLAHSQRDHPPLQFQSDEDFLAYVEALISISVFTSDVEINADDRIISLCTCAYDFDDARFIVIGVLKEL